MPEPVLSVRNLSVKLPEGADRALAVRDVSFDVNPGEIVCVVGESGSGKSVTAFTVMGLLPKGELTPVAGEVLLEGENVLTVTPQRLRDLRGTRMAMIFQEPATALNPVETVGQQIDEVLAIHTDLSPQDRRAKVIDLLESMHLPDPVGIYDKYPHQMSGGQRQRVMIAAAMALDPALLIADEPTTALDVTTQAQILQLIKELQARRGAGVLFITHDFGVVEEIADKVVVMRGGEVVEVGPAAEVLKRPREAYTKMLIEAVPSMDAPERAPATGPVAVEAIQVVKRYGGGGWFGGEGFLALKGVDLAVRRGETLGVVGESGSGKSTVARCIVRLIDPTDGAIRLGGTDIAKLSRNGLRPYRRRIQIVFQDPFRSLNPRRTVGASMIEGPVNFGLSRADAEARARRLMGLVGLQPDALDRYPHQFSGGQRQRIAIARALAMEPDVIIADEAVSALDVSVQKQVLELLDQVKRDFNLALLFITHDLRVAAQICDRIMVMSKGEVVEHGPTAALFANPQHPYTAALLAAAPGGHRREAVSA